MHELDDPNTFQKVVASLEDQLQVRSIKKIAGGNEFFIFGADLPDGKVVIKVPKDRVFSNVNDAYIDSRILLDQEFALMRYIKDKGVLQAPEPLRDLEAAGFGAVVMSYVPSDDSTPDEFALGKLLASIHRLKPPERHLSAMEGMEIPELIETRLRRRWQELNKLLDKLPSLPAVGTFVKALEPVRPVKQLLHMDFRQANFRTKKSRIVALLDWSNALIGHPALELARVAETRETGKEFLRGYGTVSPLPQVSPLIETIFRLDTAAMLALVFLSEDPDPELAPPAVARVRDLHLALNKEVEAWRNS